MKFNSELNIMGFLCRQLVFLFNKFKLCYFSTLNTTTEILFKLYLYLWPSRM